MSEALPTMFEPFDIAIVVAALFNVLQVVVLYPIVELLFKIKIWSFRNETSFVTLQYLQDFDIYPALAYNLDVCMGLIDKTVHQYGQVVHYQTQMTN